MCICRRAAQKLAGGGTFLNVPETVVMTECPRQTVSATLLKETAVFT